MEEDGWAFSSAQENVAGELIEQESEAGERYLWSLESESGRVVGEVVIPGGHFDVAWPRQVVPMVDGAFFTEAPNPQGVDEGQNPYHVLNITSGDDGGFTYRLGFPLSSESGAVELLLQRDVEPPSYQIGPVQNVTHNSFYVETETDEPALGTLWIRPVDADPEEAVRHVTTSPSFTQKFPTRGLQSNISYVFHVELTDWAGNVATSHAVEFETNERIVGAAPLIHSVSPGPDAVVQGSPEAIEVQFDAVDGEIGPDGARLFVNLQEVTSRVTVDPQGLRYVAEVPFEPGQHVVRLELANTAGGESEKRWSFTVAEGQVSSAPFAVLLAAVVLFAGAFAIRNRP